MLLAAGGAGEECTRRFHAGGIQASSLCGSFLRRCTGLIGRSGFYSEVKVKIQNRLCNSDRTYLSVVPRTSAIFCLFIHWIDQWQPLECRMGGNYASLLLHGSHYQLWIK